MYSRDCSMIGLNTSDVKLTVEAPSNFSTGCSYNSCMRSDEHDFTFGNIVAFVQTSSGELITSSGVLYV